jgi:1-acyl-sn-glycerol-3-phosphate acyltransferase
VGKCFTLQAPVDTLFQLSLDSHAMLLSLIRQILVVPAATVVLGLAVILLCPFDPSRRLFNRIARLWSRLLCLSAGVTVKVRGLEHVAPNRPAVFIANHQSLFDPPVLFLTVPGKLRVIAKRSLFLVPIFGQALWAAGVIPINRRNRQSSIASMTRAASRIRSGLSVLVFAEGTRSRDGHLLPFKKGAFVLALQAGVPVQPVLVHRSRDVLPRGALFPRRGTIEVVFLEPVFTDGMTFEDRQQLLTVVTDRMQAAQGSMSLPGAVPAAT